MRRRRVELIFVDFKQIEFSRQISDLEDQIRESLLTTGNLETAIFWMDVEEGLRRVTKMQRACFVANLIEGYSERGVAKKLKIRQPVVHRHILAARRKMKYFLMDGYQKA